MRKPVYILTDRQTGHHFPLRNQEKVCRGDILVGKPALTPERVVKLLLVTLVSLIRMSGFKSQLLFPLQLPANVHCWR